MEISRRTLLHGIGAGTLTAVTLPGMTAPRSGDGARAAEAKQSGGPIHLDRSENPYGPPEAALAAIREGGKTANRYPNVAALRKKIAEHHKVGEEQVVLGCGSTEILRMAADAFLQPGKKLVMAMPTCPLVAAFARQRGAEVVEVPLTQEQAHDLPAMLARSEGVGLVYVCNPNSPTGTLTGRKELEDFLQKLSASVAVVIDEAYHDYVGEVPSYASFLDQPVRDARTMVTRTFSAIYGLAGLRIGYAVAPAEMAKRVAEFGLALGENSVGSAAAMTALDDREYVQKSAERNRNDKQRFFNYADLRYVRVVDSHANFAMIKLDHPIDEVMAHFRANGIFVGPRFAGMDSFLRVSIGRPEEIQAFWRVWDMLPHKPVHGHAQHQG